jgi:lipopolysaccharide/colanic/teichoic acid biosynthesis glycosyltransferase
MTDRTTRPRAVAATPKTALRTPAVSIRPATPRPSIPVPERASGWGKPALDTAAALALLIPALPLMGLCVLLVRLTSAGPAVYSQTRVGRGGRVFTLYKIRSMVHDCESLTGPRWSLPGDPRITPFGRVLRALHLDELPQLFNVLKGDMSLVGPRPERPEIVKRLRLSVPGYDRRHAVKPGITGFAQIHLPPDTCVRSVKNKLAYDLFYIRHRSARMELFILAATGLKLLCLRRLFQRKPRFPTDE